MALKIGELWAALRLDPKQFNEGLDAAGQKATGFAGKMGQVGKTLTTRVSMPLVGVGAAAFKAASAQAGWAEELGNLNAATGLSTKRLQELKYIADVSGTSFEGITNTTQVLQRKLLGIEEGGGPAAEAMKQLGVSVTGTDGQLRSMDALFPEIIAALQNVENPTLRNALATQILGRNVADIAPILAMSKAEMDKMTQAARDSGKVMGDDTVKKLQAFDDAIDTITQKVQGFVTKAVAGFVSLPGPIQGAILAFLGIAAIAGPLMQVIALLSTLKTAVMAASVAANIAKLSFIQAWIAALGPIAPLVAAIAGIGLAVYAVIKYWEPIKAFFANLWKGIAGIFTTYVNWIMSLPSKVAGAWGVLKQFFANLWQAIYDATIGRLTAMLGAIANFFQRIVGMGKSAKTPAAPKPAAASASPAARPGAGQPATVKFSPDVEAAIKKTAANTNPQPRFA
jgi:phage-related protein